MGRPIEGQGRLRVFLLLNSFVCAEMWEKLNLQLYQLLAFSAGVVGEKCEALFSEPFAQHESGRGSSVTKAAFLLTGLKVVINKFCYRDAVAKHIAVGSMIWEFAFASSNHFANKSKGLFLGTSDSKNKLPFPL